MADAQQPFSRQGAASPVPSSVSGFILGAVAGLCISAAVGYVFSARAYRNARAGWNLVPVVVANQDIAVGTVVTYDMISQRPIPEQFVTTSVLKPDVAAEIVGRKTTLPVAAGDPLHAAYFNSAPGEGAALGAKPSTAAPEADRQR